MTDLLGLAFYHATFDWNDMYVCKYHFLSLRLSFILICFSFSSLPLCTITPSSSHCVSHPIKTPSQVSFCVAMQLRRLGVKSNPVELWSANRTITTCFGFITNYPVACWFSQHHWIILTLEDIDILSLICIPNLTVTFSHVQLL